MNKDYYKALDLCLDWTLKYQDAPVSYSQMKALAKIKSDCGIDDNELNEIRDKLEREKYIRKDTRLISNKGQHRITFEGYLFIQEGKYTRKKIKDDADDARIIRNEKLLRNYTLSLALGTGALVLVEIVIHWEEFSHQILKWLCISP